MKNLSQNRKLAWIVFALCVVLSINISGGTALSGLRSKAEQVFYQGINNDYLCIDKDLQARSECVYNIASTASNYPLIGEDLVNAALQASEQLATAKTTKEKYEANRLCQKAIEDLYTSIENIDLSETDKAFVFKQYKEFQSRAETIKRDAFNDEATQFNKTLSGFPAKIIGGVTGVHNLDLFSNN